MAHRKTHDEFILELNSINPEVEVLGQYTTALTKILIKCRICGNQWEAKPSALLNRSGCPECAKRRKGNALRKTHEQFVSELALVNSNIPQVFRPLDSLVLNPKEIAHEIFFEHFAA